MAKSRLTQLEANAFAAGIMSVGAPLSANFFNMFTYISMARAKELEAMQDDMSDEECAQIKAACKMADGAGVEPARPVKVTSR